MPLWNTDQYLKFANERTQPALDLVARIAVAAPESVIDLGCGPGNSTEIVARRWPGAQIVGLDNSAAMLAAARLSAARVEWIDGEIAAWAAEAPEPAFDVIFSNAALHWVPDHGRLLPRLLAKLRPGGALAFQMPFTLDDAHQRVMRDLADSAAWRGRFVRPPASWQVESLAFYYRTLAPRTARLDQWVTEYVHVLPSVDAIAEWYRGSGLRPFLEALPDESSRAAFVRDYIAALGPHYPSQPDGRVLLGFRRLFVVAYL